jgi:hypothetical protein
LLRRCNAPSAQKRPKIVPACDKRNHKQHDHADDADASTAKPTASSAETATTSAGLSAAVFDVATDVSGLPLHADRSLRFVVRFPC